MANKTIKKAWEFEVNQSIDIGNKKYWVHDCLRLAKDLPVKELRVDEMHINYSLFSSSNNTLKNFVSHMKMVLDADLSYPILMNEHGVIIDGRHRLTKCLLDGVETIKVKRFEEDPGDGFDWV